MQGKYWHKYTLRISEARKKKWQNFYKTKSLTTICRYFHLYSLFLLYILLHRVFKNCMTNLYYFVLKIIFYDILFYLFFIIYSAATVVGNNVNDILILKLNREPSTSVRSIHLTSGGAASIPFFPPSFSLALFFSLHGYYYDVNTKLALRKTFRRVHTCRERARWIFFLKTEDTQGMHNTPDNARHAFQRLHLHSRMTRAIIFSRTSTLYSLRDSPGPERFHPSRRYKNLRFYEVHVRAHVRVHHEFHIND